MPIKNVIFDFDGTIANTLTPTISIVNHFFHRGIIKKSDVLKLQNKNFSEIIFHFGISRMIFLFIFKRLQLELHKIIKTIQPIDHISKVLKDLKNSKYKLGIISSNSEENVKEFLKLNDFEFFDFVCTDKGLFDKDKAIRDVIIKQHLKPEETVYVGDEVRDIKAMKKANIKIISVSWGFNSHKILSQSHPSKLIDQPKELISAVANI